MLLSEVRVFSSKISRNPFNKELVTVQALLGITAVLIVVFLSWSSALHPNSKINNRPDSGTATLILAFDNIERTFEGETTPGMTILDAMVVSTKAGKISISYWINNKNETTVKALDDHKTISDLTVYLNSRKINIKELNKTLIKPGDIIKVRLL